MARGEIENVWDAQFLLFAASAVRAEGDFKAMGEDFEPLDPESLSAIDPSGLVELALTTAVCSSCSVSPRTAS